jgi:hypothetical protein
VITDMASLLKSRRDPEARAHGGSLRDTRKIAANRATQEDRGRPKGSRLSGLARKSFDVWLGRWPV